MPRKKLPPNSSALNPDLTMTLQNSSLSNPSEQMAKSVFWTLFIIYSLYQALVFMNAQAMVPDEYWFLKEAKDFSVLSRTAPPLDYGTIYWAILKILHYPLAIRAFFLLLFLTIPFILLSNLETQFARLVGLLVYLSFPYAFWTGKLIGPEIPYLAAMACSLFFLKRNLALSGICAGMAVGIKLNALPVLLFIGIAQLNSSKPLKNYMLIAAFFLLGLIIANPINLDLYLLHILKANSNPDLDRPLHTLRAIFFDALWSWDNLLVRSFAQILCYPGLFLCFLAIISAGSFILGAALLVFSIATAYLVLNSQFAFAWYWFALVPTMLYSIQGIENTGTLAISRIVSDRLFASFLNKFPTLRNLLPERGNYLLALLLTFAIINFVMNVPNSIFQAYEKFAQIHFIQNYPQDCVARAFNSYQPEDIINKMEFGYTLPKSEFGFALPDVPAGTVVLPPYNSSINKDKRTMIIIGRRIIANPMNFSTMVQPGYPIKLYAVCGDVFIFVNQ